MSKKQLTAEQVAEKAEKKELKAKKNFKNLVRFLEIAVAVTCIFCIITTITITSDILKTENTYTDNSNTSVAVNSDVHQNTENNNVTPDIPSAETETTVQVEDVVEEPEEAFKTPEEMVEYFNTCANKVKTDATEVVKNFEKRQVGELKVPDLLQSLAETLLKENMKDDTDPIVYSTKEDIRENFLVPSQDYVSCLKAEYVETISYEDKGSEYEFYIKLKDEKDPRAGSGVGSVCDVIETYEVAEKAPPMLEEFSTNYYDCEVTAKIDKATGRVTHIVYSTPLTLNVVVSMLGTQTASVGFTFIKDYTITY